jgi:hypothetical protein
MIIGVMFCITIMPAFITHTCIEQKLAHLAVFAFDWFTFPCPLDGERDDDWFSLRPVPDHPVLL